jgi:segregation and condensation protein B
MSEENQGNEVGSVEGQSAATIPPAEVEATITDAKITDAKIADAPQPEPSRASPALLEALLLAHGDPISYVRLQDIMRCPKTEVTAALEELQTLYSAEISGLEVVAIGEKLMLRTKPQFAEAVRDLLAVKPRKLSQAALETLSVVAYQQPIVKSEIDKIRGVDVSPTIKTLLERKLIKILGYQASVGQPSLYGTTEDFLKIFGLKGLSDLPALRDLKAIAKEPGESGDEAESNDDDVESDQGGEPCALSPDTAASPEEVVNV